MGRVVRRLVAGGQKLMASRPTAGKNGKAMAMRREPMWVETCPMSQLRAAAPRPETARMNPAARAGGRRRMRSANVEGKNGERLRPSRMQQMEIELAVLRLARTGIRM